jgi:hypothetical protein
VRDDDHATRGDRIDEVADLETLEPNGFEPPDNDPKPTHHKRSGRQRRLIAAAITSAVVPFASGVFVGFSIRQDGRDAARSSATTLPSVTTPPTTPSAFVLADISRFTSDVTTICASAYERLREEMAAAGTEWDDPAYAEAMSRYLQETLPELRALVPPDLTRDLWESIYSTLARLPDAWRADHNEASEIIHTVESQFGLIDCTMGSPR